VAVDGLDNIIVADWGNSRLQVGFGASTQSIFSLNQALGER
jgi:hypothetical protein